MNTARRRRWRLLAIATTLATVCALSGGAVLAGASTARSSDWPQTNANAASSNSNPHEKTLTAAVIESAGLGAFVPAYSLATLPPYGNCAAGRIGSAKPVVAGSSLYFFDGRYLGAHDLDTGARVWRYDLGGSTGEWVVNAVAVTGGKVLLAAFGGCLSGGDPNGTVFALNAATGALAWERTAGGSATDLSISGKTVVTATAADIDEQGLRAYNLTDGSLLWARDDCFATSTFVVATTVVTYSCGSLDLATGASTWSKPGWTFIRGDGPGASDPAIYATDNHGNLVALRPDGSVKWNAGTAYGSVYAASPTRIFARCDQTSLCALNRTTGAREWKEPSHGVAPDDMVSAGDFGVTIDGAFLRSRNGAEINLLSNALGVSGDWDWVAVAGAHIIATSERTVDVFALTS